MIRLYAAPRTRSLRARWALEELGVPYEHVEFDLKRGDQRAPEYQKIHPLGKVPAIEIDGQPIHESVAICLALGDRFADKGLAPAPSAPERAPYYTWSIYAVTEIEPTLTGTSTASFATKAAPLEAWLSTHPFAAGDRFTMADVVVGSVLAWAQGMRLVKDLPATEKYLSELKTRPAYQRARG